jgi:hypothetical protein
MHMGTFEPMQSVQACVISEVTQPCRQLTLPGWQAHTQLK